LYIAPFSDPTLFWELQQKDAFWRNTDFYGLDLNAATPRCQKEHLRQPVVDYIDPQFLVGQPTVTRFDFQTCTVEELQNIVLPVDFEINQPCLVHGIAGWFDAVFEGTNKTVTLSTQPGCPGTHWYQIRFLLEQPLAVNAGQRIEGTLKMQANNLQSYYLSINAKIDGTPICQEAPCIDLKDPEYRFYSSPNAYCPPGTANWQQSAQGTTNGVQQTPAVQTSTTTAWDYHLQTVVPKDEVSKQSQNICRGNTRSRSARRKNGAARDGAPHQGVV